MKEKKVRITYRSQEGSRIISLDEFLRLQHLNDEEERSLLAGDVVAIGDRHELLVFAELV